jgi:hypothetical protein
MHSSDTVHDMIGEETVSRGVNGGDSREERREMKSHIWGYVNRRKVTKEGRKRTYHYDRCRTLPRTTGTLDYDTICSSLTDNA